MSLGLHAMSEIYTIYSKQPLLAAKSSFYFSLCSFCSGRSSFCDPGTEVLICSNEDFFKKSFLTVSFFFSLLQLCNLGNRCRCFDELETDAAFTVPHVLKYFFRIRSEAFHNCPLCHSSGIFVAPEGTLADKYVPV